MTSIDTDYLPPLDRLLALGEESARVREWPDYLAMGIGPEHVPDLLRIARSWLEDAEDPEAPEVYAPIHAWRALGQLRAEEAARPLVEMLLERDEYDDWVYNELPAAIAMIGRSAVPVLETHVADIELDESTRIAMASALFEIAKADPEARGEVAPIFMRQLARPWRNEEGLNGFLVLYLVELRATEAVPLIERAFEADMVDTMVLGDWEDVQVELGLITERRTPRPQWEFAPPRRRLRPAAGPEKPEAAVRKAKEKEKATAAKKKQARRARKRNARRR